MYDFRPIVESFVSADNLAPSTSEFKGVSYNNLPTHIIDKYALNQNTVRYLKIKFSIEGAATAGEQERALAKRRKGRRSTILTEGSLGGAPVERQSLLGNTGA